MRLSLRTSVVEYFLETETTFGAAGLVAPVVVVLVMVLVVVVVVDGADAVVSVTDRAGGRKAGAVD